MTDKVSESTNVCCLCVFWWQKCVNWVTAMCVIVKCTCDCVSWFLCVYAYNARFKRRFDLPLLQQDPVDLSEEGVDFDGFLQPLGHHAAKTLTWALCHELKKGKIFCNIHHNLEV